jgi:putative sterol carrier protein
MDLLLVLGLLVITLGLLGGMRRSLQVTTGQEATGESTTAAGPLADGGAATSRRTDDEHREGAESFVFPASDGEIDAEGGFVFTASGRHTAHCPDEQAGEHLAMQRPSASVGYSPRDDTTKETTSTHAQETRQAINLITEREEWITAWKQAVNTDSTYHDTGAEWGVDFNGNILFIIEPDAAYDTARQYTDDDISDGIAFVTELVDGEVHSVITIALDETDQYEYGFTIHGPYAAWKALITQEIGLLDGLLSGQLTVEGDMQTLLRWSDGMVALTNSASHVKTRFPDEDETA